MGLVQAQLAIAHDHDQEFAVVAEGHLDGAEVLGGRYQLVHLALFRLHDVQAHHGTQGEELVQSVISPDRGEAEVVGRSGRGRDESILVMAVVGFNHQDAAGAAEDGHASVAGVAVEIRAAFGAVEDVAVQVPDFSADGQTVFFGVLGIVRVLKGHGEQVAFQRYHGAVVGTGVHRNGLVGFALFLQFVLVDQHKVTGTVVIHRGPVVADVHVDGAVAHEVDPQEASVPFHHVEVIAVRLKVEAAVDDAHGVGVRGNGDGEASAPGGVDAAGAGTQVELILVDATGFQVDDRKIAGSAVAYQKTTGQLHFVLFVVVVVAFGEGQFNQLLGLQSFGGDYANGVRGGSVVEQIFHVGGKARAVADHEVGLRDAHTI